MARKPGKSETLTIRLDPKSRFMLEFVSRLNGQTITTVVERAISAAADAATITKPDYVNGGSKQESWRQFWSVVEGERQLKISAEPKLHPTYEEERRLNFTRVHWPFFYTSRISNTILTHYVEVLWPRIEEFVELYEQQKSHDYFAAGKAMQQALRDANIKAPDWPLKEEPKRPSANTPDFTPGGMDDDIPF